MQLSAFSCLFMTFPSHKSMISLHIRDDCQVSLKKISINASAVLSMQTAPCFHSNNAEGNVKMQRHLYLHSSKLAHHFFLLCPRRRECWRLCWRRWLLGPVGQGSLQTRIPCHQCTERQGVYWKELALLIMESWGLWS